jgi:hypothetical protein
MAFPNTSVTDIVATAIESRTKKIADNVTKNNALLAKLQTKGNIKSISGGSVILEEISFAENGNASWYSGYDLLPVAAQDVISAAQFTYKQIAVPVVISGLEQLQNSGKEATIDLIAARVSVAEGTMKNLMSEAIYGDGTGYGGKTLVGLDAAVPATVTSGQTNTYGGISRSTWAFWKSYSVGSETLPTSNVTAATYMPTLLNRAYTAVSRGSDHTDLIVMDNNYWSIFLACLQNLQRFTSPEVGAMGFPSQKFLNADVVFDGGIGGFAYTNGTTGGTAYLLNTDYFRLRPHKDRNMVALSPNRRYAVNQDAEVQILAWAGALTCNGARFQGRNFTTG